MSAIYDIDPLERTNLITELSRCMGTMVLEHQEQLLEYFVDALLSCGVKPEEIIFYRDGSSRNEWHGIQLGTGQSFGIGAIRQAKLPLSRSLRLRAQSINTQAGTWLYNWDTTLNCLQVTHNGQDYMSSPSFEHIENVLEDIIDGPQNVRGDLKYWLRTKRNVAPEELAQQAGVIESFVRSAVLHGLGPRLQPLGDWSYGVEQGRWHWRRTLKIEVVGSNRLLLTSQGLPITSVPEGGQYDHDANS